MATFYADSAGVQGTADGSSAANATTLKLALENNSSNVSSLHTGLVAGSVIYCKNGTTITYDGSTASFATTAQVGTASAPIRLVGYGSSVTDGGAVVLSDSDSGNTNSCIVLAVSYWEVANFSADGVRRLLYSNAAIGGITITNCVAKNTKSYGFFFGGLNTISPRMFNRCRAEGCAFDGFYDKGRASRYNSCVAIDNTGSGFLVLSSISGYGPYYNNCLSAGNLAKGFVCFGGCTLANCLAYGNTSDGIYLSSAHPTTIINSSCAANGGYGVNGVTNILFAINCDLNPTNEMNTSGASHANITVHADDAVTGDPLFTATASDDYSLGSSSAWKAGGAGLGDDGFTATSSIVDIGPAQRAESGGGGSPGNMQGGLQ